MTDTERPARLFEAARRASGMTLDRAAEACGVSRPTYASRERDPSGFHLSEIRGLYAAMDGIGRDLLVRGIAILMQGGSRAGNPADPDA